MPGFLLDTHTLLWFVENNPRLGSTARRLIETTNEDVLVSLASLWEIAVKQSIGKLTLAMPLSDFIDHRILSAGFGLLSIDTSHLVRVATLPLHHRDPFDRLLAAQCLSDSLTILSADAVFDLYGVPRQWN